LLEIQHGSITIYIGPDKPTGKKSKNWIPTVKGKAWFPYFRFDSPKKAFPDRTWVLPFIEKAASLVIGILMPKDPLRSDTRVSRNRLIAGAVIFVAGQLAPLAIPVVASSSLPATWKTALPGLLLLGVPEIAILLTIVVLGRAGFNALKSRLFGSLKDTLFPDTVSRRRYHAGLILFLIPILFGWLSPYVYASVPELMRHRLTVAIIGGVLLIAGVCLMGGQFWDKLRALVLYDAEVTLSPAARGANC